MIDVTVPMVVGGAALAGVLVVAPITKYALDMYPYLYANTRCASRAGLLLTAKQYDELLGAASVEEVWGILEDSAYGGIVEHHKDFFTFSRALERDVSSTLDWLFELAPAPVKPIISALQKRSEVNTLKAIMSALKNGEELPVLDQIQDEVLRVKLEGVKDVQSFQVALELSVYGELLQSIDVENMAAAHTLLDRHVLVSLLEAIERVKERDVKEAFLSYFAVWVDLFNVRLALRKGTDFVQGGVLNRESLAASDEHQLENLFMGSVYGAGMAGFSVTRVEQAFFTYLRKQAEIIGAKYTLKAGSLLRFLIQKEIEIRNVNTLVKLKGEGFDEETVKSYVVM